MARPRRSLEQRLELARLNEARAAERLARKTRKVQKYESVQKARDRKLDTRRKIIAGALALEHMRHDPEWGVVFRELLDQYVVKEPERLLFGLPPLPPEAGDGGADGKRGGKGTADGMTGGGGARPAPTGGLIKDTAAATATRSATANNPAIAATRAPPPARLPSGPPAPASDPTAPPVAGAVSSLPGNAGTTDLRSLAGPAAASVRVGGTTIGPGQLTPAPRPTAGFFRLHGKK